MKTKSIIQSVFTCLALAIALDGRPDVFAIAADTDGIDGASQAAGAFITPNTLTRATAQGLDPHAHLGGLLHCWPAQRIVAPVGGWMGHHPEGAVGEGSVLAVDE